MIVLCRFYDIFILAISYIFILALSTHKDYQYTNEWLEFILKLFEEEKLSIEEIKKLYKNKEKLEIQEYE